MIIESRTYSILTYNTPLITSNVSQFVRWLRGALIQFRLFLRHARTILSRYCDPARITAMRHKSEGQVGSRRFEPLRIPSAGNLTRRSTSVSFSYGRLYNGAQIANLHQGTRSIDRKLRRIIRGSEVHEAIR